MAKLLKNLTDATTPTDDDPGQDDIVVDFDKKLNRPRVGYLAKVTRGKRVMNLAGATKEVIVNPTLCGFVIENGKTYFEFATTEFIGDLSKSDYRARVKRVPATKALIDKIVAAATNDSRLKRLGVTVSFAQVVDHEG